MMIRISRSSHIAKGPKVFAKHLRDLCSKSELDQFREIALRVANIRSQFAEVGIDMPAKNLKAAQAAYNAAPSEANLVLLKARENRAQAQETNAAMRMAIKRAMREVSAEALPILDSMKRRGARIVKERIDQLTAIEENAAREVGIQFVASETLGALANLLNDHLQAPFPEELAASVFVEAREVFGLSV